MFDEPDDIEAEGERRRQAILAALELHGCTSTAVGIGIAALVASDDEEIKAKGLSMALDLMAARPSRTQKHKVTSEQRILSVKFDGRPNELGINDGLIRRLPAEQRQKAIEVMAAIKAIAPDDGAEVPNGGA